MSWFSDIAGRAEALLDRVDQAAASSIQGVGLGASPKQKTGQTSLAYEPTATVNEEKATNVPSKPPSSPLLLQKSKTSTQSYASVSRPEPAPKSPPTPTSYQSFSKGKDAAPSDDSIFEFLNTPSKESMSEKRHKPKTRPRRASPRDSAGSQLKPFSPVKAQPSVTLGEEGERKKQEGGSQAEEVAGEEEGSQGRGREEADGELVKEDTVLATPPAPQPTVEGERQAEEPTPATSAPHAGLEQQLQTLRQKVSSLELENKLLKREVASLNDELGTLMERVREAEEGVAAHRGEVEALREQATRSDHVIRQLRSQEEDLQAGLEARDSQIRVLRKELREVEQREAVLQERLDSHGREKERLVQDATLSSEAHSYALEGLKSQLAETELQLKHEREATQAMKAEFAERESLLQHEQQQLSEALATQQRQLALQQAKCVESQTAVQAAHRELQKLQKEQEDYKKRAAGILQAKEKLISSLQAGGGSGPAHEAKVEELRLEKEHLQAELERTQQQWAELKEELQETEERHAKETEDLLERVQQLESNLMAERSLQRSAQEDAQRVSLELEAARENWERESSSLARLAKEKEAEIEELKARVPATPLSPHSHSELESRLHELTESLIQKQTTLEALSSEKNSLRVQLERTESQLLNARRAHPPPTHTTVNGLDSGATEARIRPMTSVLPVTDPTHSGSRLQGVRRAMNSLDSFSVRLALFLRRYPYARLFVFVYMVLLHVWVLIVLLTYSPEVHDLTDPQFRQLP